MTAKKGVTVASVLKSIYYNEFQWAVVKSFGMFLLGIRIAKEFTGIEVMPAIAPH